MDSKPEVTLHTVTTTNVYHEPKPSIQHSVILEKSHLVEQQKYQQHQQLQQQILQHKLHQHQQKQPQVLPPMKENSFVPIKEEIDEIKPRQFTSSTHKPPPSIPHPHIIQQPQHHHQQQQQHQLQQQQYQQPQVQHQQSLHMELLSGPPSPEVPEDLEKLEKINERFKLNRTDPHSTCSRCERIYTFQRPKKQRNPEAEVSRRLTVLCVIFFNEKTLIVSNLLCCIINFP